MSFAVPAGAVAVLSNHVGLPGAVALLMLWVHAISDHVWHYEAVGRTGVAARAALLAGLALSLAGAVPTSPVAPAWMVALGTVMALARVDRESRAG